MTELGFLWILFGLLAGHLYKKKGKSYSRGFAIGFLLGPIGIIMVMVTKTDTKELRKREREEEDNMVSSGEMKRCPSCSTLIRPEANTCPQCLNVIVAII